MSTHRTLLPGMAFSLGFGCAFGGLLGPSLWALLPAALALCGALRRRSGLWLWIAAFSVGIAIAPVSPPPPVRVPLLRGVRGRVVSLVEPGSRDLSFVLELAGSGIALQAHVPAGTHVSYGDEVALRGRGEVPRGGWGRYLANRGVSGVFWAERAEVVGRGGTSLGRVLDRWRRAALGKLQRAFPGGEASLVQALLFGARGLLPRETKEGFRRAGVAHLLALSGLHLGIIAAGIWWGLGPLGLRPGKRYLAAFGLVALYVGLGGMRVSLVRAGIMFGSLGLFWLFAEGGTLLRSWYDPLQGLSLAALIVLLIWPWSAVDLGFELSFAATAAILLLWPGWRASPLRGSLPRFLRRPADLAAVSLMAQAGTLGFVGSSFGYISLYGPLSNPVLIPWTALIIWSGLVVLVLPLPLAKLLGTFLGQFLISPYLEFVGRISSLPGATLPVAPTFGLWYALAALALFSLREWVIPAGRR